MERQEWQFTTPAPVKQLYAVSYTGKEPKAVLFFHHGINEHIGRYAECLVQQGIDCHSYDARSFGKSETNNAERGKIENFEHLVTDYLAFIDKIEQEQYASSKVPVFLGGQSMGALVAASAVAKRNATAAGLILFSPAMDVDKGPILMVQAALAGPLAAAMPWVRAVPAVRVEDLSEDPEVCKRYVEDPLNFPGKIRMRTGQQVNAGMQRLKAVYKDITLPVYGVHGESDRTTSLKAHRRFIDAISSKDKTLEIVPGGYHELLHGPQRHDVVRKAAAWLLEHAAAHPARSAL